MSLILFWCSLYSSIIVTDSSSSSCPSLFVLLMIFNWENSYFHSLTIEILFFNHVEYMHSNLSFLFIFHSKEKPLIISMSISIIFKQNVVISRLGILFIDKSGISWLEVAIKIKGMRIGRDINIWLSQFLVKLPVIVISVLDYFYSSCFKKYLHVKS